MARRKRFSDEPLGPTIERLMLRSGVSYRELSSRTGVSAGYLNHIVHGNRSVPADDLIEVIAGALGVDVEYFLEYRLRRVVHRLEAMHELANSLYTRLNGQPVKPQRQRERSR
jgi:transcriptional regulator with XRE-family HTH domain